MCRVVNAILLSMVAVASLSIATASDGVPVPVSPAEQARLWAPAVRHQVEKLRVSGAGDGSRVLAALEALRSDPALDAVTRDAVAYAYVAALRRGSTAAVPDAVLDRLEAWQPLAWRHHEESSTALVPLFDVASAAQGLRNELRFQQGFDAMRSEPGRTFAKLYYPDSTRDSAWERGARAAVAALPPAAIPLDLKRGGTDGLTIDVALARRDVDVLAAGVADSSAGEASGLLGRLSSSFSPKDAYRIVLSALDHRDPGVRSVAMAGAGRLAQADPSLAGDWQQRLVDLLLDPDIGATAAMQLAAAPDSVLDAIRASRVGDARLTERLELIARLRATRPEVDRHGGARQ